MPIIKAPATVLVTGASGFIAIWICKVLLEAGYTVRGTVRSASKGDYLVDSFKSNRFSYIIVEDIAKDGAFNEAVKGADAVVHTASPFHFNIDEPEGVIIPAVQGTVGVLKSIEKNAPNVKRVIVTSSVAAIVDSTKPVGTVYTEEDWNMSSVQEVQEKGRTAAGGDKYRASKTLAEKAAWAEVERQKPSWDLVTINPPMVFGPILQQVDDPAQLNASVAGLYKVLHQEEGAYTQAALVQSNGNLVDVRDVALAHVRALEVPDAGGHRFITASSAWCWQDILDVLPPWYPRGTPGAGKGIIHNVYDASRARNILGIKFRGLEETIKDTELGFRKHGWGWPLKSE